ncbi:MAG: hypothetical protein K0R18_557 [Bacillales bacterium]|jgi:uncharacterized protein YjcR|nr:hypothetical protein [Bacillales bacterium]
MSRPISTNRLKALKIWLKSGREKKPKQIAEELGVSPNLIRKWKSVDRWEEIPITPPKRGAPYRNKNAVGNKGGPGGPIGNDKAVKHGLFRKWMPNDEETLEIYDATREMPMLDLLYEEIRIAFTNIIRAQKIMFVQNKDDMTKELKKEKFYKEKIDVTNSDGEVIGEEYLEISVEREYEIQFGWDKQAKALTSQAAAMRALTNKIKQYEEMIRSMPPDEVKEEHRLRIEKLKADIIAASSKAW